MSEAKNLIEAYSNQMTEALTEKQLEKALVLSKEFEVEVRKLADPTDDITTELEIFARNESRKTLGRWLRAAEIHPSVKYVEALCAILHREKNSYLSKSIIDVLNAIQDERTIPCLERLLNLEIDYDSEKDLSIKILIALGELGTPKAREVIQNYLDSPHQKIRDDAKLVLSVLAQQNNSV